ncbi:tyrosine-type recombinase/integrase [Streptacidiphilus monticola]|uniref:Tyrosine-type recombinase/integrase n=1 Tax=Streptacidiphilus monticola TaxID=2161674 RepID=A0ABW1G3C5_9ACTN
MKQFAEKWLASLSMDPQSYLSVEQRIRLHVIPHLGGRPLGSLRPSHIREWLVTLANQGLSPATQRVVFAHLGTMLTAAVEDHLIPKNPCRSTSVRAPKLSARRIVPWPSSRVLDVRAALPEKYRTMVDLAGGCGMRQGEVFGLSADDLDFDAGTVRVVRQIRLLRNRPVFSLPKGGKTRTVPLPDIVAGRLRAHIETHPPVSITLPWRDLDGPPTTVRLLYVTDQGHYINRSDFNRVVWRPSVAAAGVPLGRDNGMHALRHFYASVLLDAGESIKALSDYLGHHDPGFTLRTYTHLMPSSEKRTKEAVNHAFGGRPEDGRRPQDGPGGGVTTDPRRSGPTSTHLNKF